MYLIKDSVITRANYMQIVATSPVFRCLVRYSKGDLGEKYFGGGARSIARIRGPN